MSWNVTPCSRQQSSDFLTTHSIQHSVCFLINIGSLPSKTQFLLSRENPGRYTQVYITLKLSSRASKNLICLPGIWSQLWPETHTHTNVICVLCILCKDHSHFWLAESWKPLRLVANSLHGVYLHSFKHRISLLYFQNVGPYIVYSKNLLKKCNGANNYFAAFALPLLEPTTCCAPSLWEATLWSSVVPKREPTNP